MSTILVPFFCLLFSGCCLHRVTVRSCTMSYGILCMLVHLMRSPVFVAVCLCLILIQSRKVSQIGEGIFLHFSMHISVWQNIVYLMKESSSLLRNFVALNMQMECIDFSFWMLVRPISCIMYEIEVEYHEWKL